MHIYILVQSCYAADHYWLLLLIIIILISSLIIIDPDYWYSLYIYILDIYIYIKDWAQYKPSKNRPKFFFHDFRKKLRRSLTRKEPSRQ